MKEMWDARYLEKEYVYGKAPNAFLKTQIEGLDIGKMLLPAEGEGRNAVYAASLEWEVSAFDFSAQARVKALQLARENNLNIDYKVHGIESSDYEKSSFDLIALIYAHTTHRKDNHRKLMEFLKPGAVVLLEAFSKAQIENNTGGPKDLGMLYSIEELKDDFSELSDVKVWEEEIVLDEGEFHQGKSSVIRLIGIK